MSTTVRLVCWLDVKAERKIGKALARLEDGTGWDGVAWDSPQRDGGRGLFRVTGSFASTARGPADALYELLVSLRGVTNHCTVSGPRFGSDGSWEFEVSASGRQVDAQSVEMLIAEITGLEPDGGYEPAVHPA